MAFKIIIIKDCPKKWNKKFKTIQASRENSSSPPYWYGNIENKNITMLEEPYMMLKQNSQFATGNDRFEGYLADLMRNLATKLNENYELRLSRDGSYGLLNEEGTWTGSVGEVLSEVSDIALGPLIIDELKHQYVDFSEPFLTLRSSGLVRRNNFFKPKKEESERKQHNNNPPFGQQPQNNEKLLGQANSDWNNLPISGKNLLLNRNYTIGFLRNGPAQKWLSTSKDSVLRQAWARASNTWPCGIVESIQEGIERTRREQFLFIVDTATAEYVAGKKPCDLVATEPFLEPVKYALIIRKTDEKLKKNLDKYLREMRDNSELQNLYLKWWKDECKKFNSGPTSEGKDNKQQLHKRQPAEPLADQQPLESILPNVKFHQTFKDNSTGATTNKLPKLLILILLCCLKILI
ncbi:hypothetical protein HELRODRAFT_189414 [Helobdella robusta]|uniref:Ionotropic glutamate receptor L-glutamate and glycine-binding domain-containing protein n=1 Tax=Helobdella robusta TaxID=6412 RepID=T1FR15_HELRO|nr:hypothetical protein HELRODRAFT_189414 [Helobdella robusta]ESN94502.1 hypothetical protein HELRODRAFT_189414 [Helobdella robusta]